MSPRLQRAPPDNDRRDRTTSFVELALDNHAGSSGLRVGCEFFEFGDEIDHFDELIDSCPGGRRNFDGDRVTTQGLRNKPVFSELSPDPVGIRHGHVDLVDRHDDVNVGHLGVTDGLNRLRHDPVVGRYDQNDNVRYLGASRPHRGERFMAGGVDEGEFLAGPVNLIGPDVLGDATRLTGDHVGLANPVEKCGFPVIHMTHDGHHRGPWYEVCRVVFEDPFWFGANRDRFLDNRFLDFDLIAKLLAKQHQRFVGDRSIARPHFAHQQQCLDDFADGPADSFSKNGRSRTGFDRQLRTGCSRVNVISFVGDGCGRLGNFTFLRFGWEFRLNHLLRLGFRCGWWSRRFLERQDQQSRVDLFEAG